MWSFIYAHWKTEFSILPPPCMMRKCRHSSNVCVCMSPEMHHALDALTAMAAVYPDVSRYERIL